MKGQKKEQIAEFFNVTTDTMGNHLLHVCASYGSCMLIRWCVNCRLTDSDDVMDELLNVEFLECDPLTRREGETPIHCAVKYANEREADLGQAMAQMLIDAGGDPRVKDKHGRKPSDICTPRTEELQLMLRKEEYIANEGLKHDIQQEDEDGPTGSASDSE